MILNASYGNGKFWFNNFWFLPPTYLQVFKPIIKTFCRFFLQKSTQWSQCNKKWLLLTHSGPERVYKKINSSEVWCIFLKTKLYDNSKKFFLKIFAVHPRPLDTCIFWKIIAKGWYFWGFRDKIAVLRHLEGFLKKKWRK